MGGFDGVARMTAWYNEIDPQAAAHLRALIAAGHIAPGIVDERSIEDVTPADLAPFTQCHFFAGIGVWSYALRAAGITDDTPIWTGSCPCQPFSTAGQGAGFADERHLWPHFHYLIAQRKPPTVIGEQVASKDAGPWIDLVHTDMEALDYAFGAVPFPTAGIGGPHIRDRLYWVAQGDPRGAGLEGHAGHGGTARRTGPVGPIAAPSVFSGMGHAKGERGGTPGAHGGGGEPQRADGAIGIGQFSGMADAGRTDNRSEVETANIGQSETDRPTNQPGGCIDTLDRLGHPNSHGTGRNTGAICGPQTGESGRGCGDDASASGGVYGLADTNSSISELAAGNGSRPGETNGGRASSEFERCDALPDSPAAGPVNGFWRDADWLYCRDGKWRPVEPGTQPLAYGMPRSMGVMSPELQRLAEVAGLSSASLRNAKAYRTSALRGYGNAINAAAAQAFIEEVFK